MGNARSKDTSQREGQGATNIEKTEVRNAGIVNHGEFCRPRNRNVHGRYPTIGGNKPPDKADDQGITHLLHHIGNKNIPSVSKVDPRILTAMTL